MTPDRLLGLGLLIALLLPSLIALTERRRLHDAFRALLAIGGLAYCWTTGGGTGLMLGICSGIGTLLLLTALVAFTQKLWGARLLSGGEIKQLAGGAAWLYPPAAVVYLAVTLGFAIIAITVGKRFALRLRNGSLVAASSLALLVIFINSGFA